ncbi:MAG: lipid-binding SYLF domain-containing protein [Chlorobiaceae bacterium]|nr:lipid-binding SYLF domain-containing protein [Chlorobiaceae bacterium]
MMKHMGISRILVIALAAVTMMFGTAKAGWDPADEQRAHSAIEKFKQKDPSLDRFFSKAYGYAVFPEVFKGGFMIIGGGHGSGYVFENGVIVGRSSITQLNLGPQLGGQSFGEIIFFKSKADLDNFKSGNFELNAQAGAVVATTGIATNADYSNGVAVFVMANGGIMAEASVGGQKFSYRPIDQ